MNHNPKKVYIKRCHIIPKSEMMALELLKTLPPEIIMSILSKLPVRTIIICKCVCKAWLHIVENPEFVKLHLSTSVPGLVTFQLNKHTTLFKYFEVEDGRDVEHHDLPYNLVTKFNLPFFACCIRGSVDGLFWWCNKNAEGDVICVCNPITRDYITIHTPSNQPRQLVTCGFGSCKMTGQYKVVWMLLDRKKPYDPVMSVAELAECHVYTLGAGSGWRRLSPCALLHRVPLKVYGHGVFANGNLHWLGCDLKGCLKISCFDLETERFSTFSAPLLRAIPAKLFALEESLCLCGTTNEGEIGIWSMEEYGVAESWTLKQKLVIERGFAVYFHPIKVFKDGDILMAIDDSRLFCYSTKTTTIRQVDMFKDSSKTPENEFVDFISAISHTPSFRSLKSFRMENVSSF